MTNVRECPDAYLTLVKKRDANPAVSLVQAEREIVAQVQLQTLHCFERCAAGPCSSSPE